MSIKKIRAKTGMSQAQFAEHFHIPVRTLQKWERGGSTPAPYIEYLLEQVLCKNIHAFPEEKPEFYKPVLCLLENNEQVTAALDENGTDWIGYNSMVIQERVVGWKKLEEFEELMIQRRFLQDESKCD